MDGKVAFLTKFNKYFPGIDNRVILEKATVSRFRADKEKRILEAFVDFPSLVEKDALYEIEREIAEAYQLNGMIIYPQYPSELFSEKYLPEAIRELQRTGAVSR